MSFEFIGCMVNSSSGWQPVWLNPCTGVAMVGCMVNSSAGWAPYLAASFGINCSIDQLGCMKLISEKWTPVLIIEEYDSIEEMAFDCCSSCPQFPFWPEGEAPQFITVEFEDIVKCDPIGACNIDGVGEPGSFNLEFTLEYLDWRLGGSGCNWCFSDMDDGGSGFAIYVGISSTTFFFHARWCWGFGGPPPAGCGNTGNQWFFIHNALLVDLDIDNLNNTIAGCTSGIRGVGGTAVINWDP